MFSSQYALKNLTLKNIDGVIVSFENSELAQKMSAQIVLGKKQALGKLPASINNAYPVNYGI